MVSDFRKKKLMHVFNAFFDSNKSGTIDKKDFELAIEKIAKLRGWNKGEMIYDYIHDTVMQLWDGLQKQADSDNDGEISIEEWIQMWDKYAKNPDEAAEWQNLYCRFVFEMEDATRDGSIDCEEFSTVYEAFGLDKEESIDAFKKMSKGKDSVTWPEFQELWKEYFTTEDKDAPGNFIFGCYICSLHNHSHSHSH